MAPVYPVLTSKVGKMVTNNLQIEVAEPDETRRVGERLAKLLGPGDLVMLSGELGAGKTTFTQGIGKGMGVHGNVSSPTFIVARVHPPEGGSVPLIHVDAYRIEDAEDLETLDLESSLSESVTVIEWGKGKTEGLSEDRLEVDIIRPTGGTAQVDADGTVDLTQMDDGKRTLRLTGHGQRWANIDLRQLGEDLSRVFPATGEIPVGQADCHNGVVKD